MQTKPKTRILATSLLATALLAIPSFAAADVAPTFPATTLCAPATIILCFTPGGLREVREVTDPDTSTWGGPSHSVWGYLQTYLFTSPLGGQVSIRCAEAIVDGYRTSPCDDAGGVHDGSTPTTLITGDFTEPPGPAVATIRICEATLTAIVAGNGVRDMPIMTVC